MDASHFEWIQCQIKICLTHHSSVNLIDKSRVYLAGSVLSRQALSPFLASRCYNVYGQVQLQLRCPFGHGVRTLLAFTAVSRHDACSYEPWDCIVRPISSHRCEGRTTCFISDRITEENEAQWGHLVCGQGTTPYMHIEYECILLTGECTEDL